MPASSTMFFSSTLPTNNLSLITHEVWIQFESTIFKLISPHVHCSLSFSLTLSLCVVIEEMYENPVKSIKTCDILTCQSRYLPTNQPTTTTTTTNLIKYLELSWKHCWVDQSYTVLGSVDTWYHSILWSLNKVYKNNRELEIWSSKQHIYHYRGSFQFSPLWVWPRIEICNRLWLHPLMEFGIIGWIATHSRLLLQIDEPLSRLSWNHSRLRFSV